MRVAIILPRGTHFASDGATAIDLCVRDSVHHSAYHETTKVYGLAVATPFIGVSFQGITPAKRDQKSIAAEFAKSVLIDRPDIVVVHQHLPMAAHIQQLLSPIPVILHKHGFAKADGLFQRFRHARLYNRFAATMWVSNTARDDFSDKYPNQAARSHVTCNGLNMDDWSPARNREKVIVVVGRAVPEKGILEAAKGIAHTLDQYRDWRTLFILSNHDENSSYLQEVQNELNGIGQQATLLLDQPHEQVKASVESSAIALVPSTGVESFGRTALEAMAGGAALISSTRGGLREVAQDCAVMLEAVTPESISHAISDLITQPERCAAMAEKGREVAGMRYDIKITSAAIDAVYREVFARSK